MGNSIIFYAICIYRAFTLIWRLCPVIIQYSGSEWQLFDMFRVGEHLSLFPPSPSASRLGPFPPRPFP